MTTVRWLNSGRNGPQRLGAVNSCRCDVSQTVARPKGIASTPEGRASPNAPARVLQPQGTPRLSQYSHEREDPDAGIGPKQKHQDPPLDTSFPRNCTARVPNEKMEIARSVLVAS